MKLRYSLKVMKLRDIQKKTSNQIFTCVNCSLQIHTSEFHSSISCYSPLALLPHSSLFSIALYFLHRTFAYSSLHRYCASDRKHSPLTDKIQTTSDILQNLILVFLLLFLFDVDCLTLCSMQPKVFLTASRVFSDCK